VDERSETDAKLSRLRQAFIKLEARDPESPSAGFCRERLKIVIESCADDKGSRRGTRAALLFIRRITMASQCRGFKKLLLS